VLVTGLGPVGLGAVGTRAFRNARVIGVEPMPWRRERAMQMGAEAVFAPDEPDLVDKIRRATAAAQGELRIECSGRLSSQRLCIDASVGAGAWRLWAKPPTTWSSGEPRPVAQRD
jgi:threonine dehydrogenase-like Zn-dependent dehydrogenase